MNRSPYRDRALQLRQEYIASLIARGRAALPSFRTAALALTYALLLAIAAVSAASAQRPTAADDAALAPYGVSTQTVEDSTDEALLWRIVREVVLPGRVSAATEHAILLRLWQVDRSLAAADLLDMHHDGQTPDDATALARIQTGRAR